MIYTHASCKQRREIHCKTAARERLRTVVQAHVRAVPEHDQVNLEVQSTASRTTMIDHALYSTLLIGFNVTRDTIDTTQRCNTSISHTHLPQPVRLDDLLLRFLLDSLYP